MKLNSRCGLFLLALGFVLSGCGDDEQPKECKEAEFGQVEMSFATGNEIYLMAVFTLPEDEAAADELVTFKLDAGGTPSGALRIQRYHRPSGAGYDRDYWEARLAFERERRAGISDLVDTVRSSGKPLMGMMPRQACEPCATSTTEMCWQGACVSSVSVARVGAAAVNATLAAVVGSGSVKVNVLVDNNVAASSAAAVTAATSFANSISTILDLMGQSSYAAPLDRNGDSRMTVVYTNKLGGIVGGFDFRDFLSAEGSGNEHDMMWAAVPAVDTMATCPAGGCATSVITQELSAGTLVHEMTHLINFAVRVYGAGAAPKDNETLWLDEAMAHLMEDVAGFGASNIGTAAVALDSWSSTTFAGPGDSVAQRGMGYTLLRHIIDQESGASDAAAANAAFKLHDALVGESERGWQHSIFQNRGADGVWKWLLAIYATNNTDVTETDAQSTAFADTATVNGQVTGFDPFGSFTDARGVAIDFSGPNLGDGSTDEIDDLSEPFESEVASSGGVLYLVKGLDGDVTLTGTGDTCGNLNIRAARVQ